MEARAEDNHHRIINPARTQKATDSRILAQAIQISSSVLFNRNEIRRIIPSKATGNIHRYNIAVAVAALDKVSRVNK